MKPRRTHESNTCLDLHGGNEDNSLWVRAERFEGCGHVTITSVWEPTEEERQLLAEGHNIELTLFGTEHPPVRVQTTDVELGKGPPLELNLREAAPMTEQAAITLAEHFMEQYKASTGESVGRELPCRYTDIEGQERVVVVSPPEGA